MRNEGSPRNMEDRSEQPPFRLYGSFDVTKSTIDHAQLRKVGKKIALGAAVGVTLAGGSACGGEVNVSAQDIAAKPSPTPISQEGGVPVSKSDSLAAFVDAKEQPLKELGEVLTEEADKKAAESAPTVVPGDEIKLDPTAAIVSGPTEIPTEIPSLTPEAPPTEEGRLSVAERFEKVNEKRSAAEDQKFFYDLLKQTDLEGRFLFDLSPAEQERLTPKQLEHTWVEVTTAKQKIDKRVEKLNALQKTMDEKKAAGKDYAAEQEKIDNMESFFIKIGPDEKTGNNEFINATINSIKKWLAEEMGLRGDELLDATQRYKKTAEEFWDPEKSPIRDSYPFFPASKRYYIDVSYDAEGNLIFQWMETESDLYEEAVARSAQ